MARPKDFDHDIVLEKAMNVFWEKGFAGASLAALTEATGLHKGSLYGAFKSKENLFKLALKKYGESSRSGSFKKGTATKYLKDFYKRLVTEGACEKGDKGCLIMNASLEFGTQEGGPSEIANDLLNQVEKNLRMALETSLEERELEIELSTKEMGQRLLGLAFTLRKLGKFKKDKLYLTNIANGVLKEIQIQL
jgi:TetR/AcrR family transcriptional repressor of nem operon